MMPTHQGHGTKELGPSVKVINDGGLEFCQKLTEINFEGTMAEWKAQTPVGRNGTPADVASAMCYLADAEFITGQVLPVNGGFVI